MGDAREINYKSFKYVESEAHNAVKNGTITEAVAKEVIDGARESYRNGEADKIQDRRKK